MKKVAAVFISILVYISAFMMLFFFSVGQEIRLFLFGFPLAAAVYFVIAGNIFARCLQLNRWFLWLGMNLIGGLGSWMILFICFPSLLMNGFILIFLVPMAGIFAVVWLAVGLGFLCVKGFKSIASSAAERSGTFAVCSLKTDLRSQKAQSFLDTAGVRLLILARAFGAVGENLSLTPPQPNPRWPWELTVGGYSENRPNPHWQTIEEELRELSQEEDSFLILEQKDTQAPEAYWFIQCAVAKQGPNQGKYMVEIGAPVHGSPCLWERVVPDVRQAIDCFFAAYHLRSVDVSGFEKMEL